MKLAHPQLDTVFSLEQGVNSLVVENPEFFRELLRDMANQMEGLPGKWVLSQNHVPIDFGKHAELIDSVLSFRMSRKSLVNKLIARLEAEAVNEENFLRTAEFLSRLEQFVGELCFDLPCDVTCSKLNFGNLLKAIGLAFHDDYESDLERFLDFMELTRELDRPRVFVFVNLRSFYRDEDVSSFLESAVAHEHRIFLVDSRERIRLPMEHRVVIDDDLCEF